MFGSGRESHPNVREWSGGRRGITGVVGSLYRLSRNGRESLPDVREWSVVVSSSGTTLPNIQEW